MPHFKSNGDGFRLAGNCGGSANEVLQQRLQSGAGLPIQATHGIHFRTRDHSNSNWHCRGLNHFIHQLDLFMTSARKIKQRLKAIRPRTFTLSCWVKIPGEDWKVITKVISSLSPKKAEIALPNSEALIYTMMLERGDTSAKWAAISN
jgi:hypothetical protein